MSKLCGVFGKCLEVQALWSISSIFTDTVSALAHSNSLPHGGNVRLYLLS